jgi:hypothetical protein
VQSKTKYVPIRLVFDCVLAAQALCSGTGSAPQRIAYAVVVLPALLSPVFSVKPFQQEPLRNSTRKPNKNNTLAPENNLP